MEHPESHQRNFILGLKCDCSIWLDLRCLVKYIALGLVIEANLEDGNERLEEAWGKKQVFGSLSCRVQQYLPQYDRPSKNPGLLKWQITIFDDIFAV